MGTLFPATKLLGLFLIFYCSCLNGRHTNEDERRRNMTNFEAMPFNEIKKFNDWKYSRRNSRYSGSNQVEKYVNDLMGHAQLMKDFFQAIVQEPGRLGIDMSKIRRHRSEVAKFFKVIF